MIREKTHWEPKGWGGELWICNNDDYCGKILYIMAGRKFSFHYHKEKKEHFYLLKGTLNILCGATDEIAYASTTRLHQGEVIFIKPGVRHQCYALEDCQIIEISTTHKEEDSIRVIKGD